MIKYQIYNRWNGIVQFTAEIDCRADDPEKVKRGMAAIWAVENDVNLAGADLAGADLAGAYMARAWMARANLASAYLAGASGNMLEIKSAQFDTWGIAWTQSPAGEMILQIGCQRHPLALWEKSDPRWIAKMDANAADWWGRYRDVVIALVKASPAVPFGDAKVAAKAPDGAGHES